MTDVAPGFEGVDHMGLEVEPTGPYMVLGPPRYFETILSPPEASFLGPTIRVSTRATIEALRVTALVERSGRVRSVLGLTGRTHLRGFAAPGSLLWSCTAAGIRVQELTRSAFGHLPLVVFDLLVPFEVRGPR